MATAPDNPPTTPPADSPPSEGMRKLDEAAGGGEVPIGPLGGPQFKTNDQLNAERIKREEEQAAAEKAAAEAATGGDTSGGAAPDNPLTKGERDGLHSRGQRDVLRESGSAA